MDHFITSISKNNVTCNGKPYCARCKLLGHFTFCCKSTITQLTLPVPTLYFKNGYPEFNTIVNGLNAKVVFDTTAHISYIQSVDLIEDFDNINQMNLTICGNFGYEYKAIGQVKITFMIQGYPITEDFYVIDTLQKVNIMALGKDFLQRSGCCIDYSLGKLQLTKMVPKEWVN